MAALWTRASWKSFWSLSDNVAEAHDELGALSASRQDVYGALFHEGCGLRTDLGELH